MAAVQVRLGFDDTRTLMKEIDSDGSGTINYREFVRFLRGSGCLRVCVCVYVCLCRGMCVQV